MNHVTVDERVRHLGTESALSWRHQQQSEPHEFRPVGVGGRNRWISRPSHPACRPIKHRSDSPLGAGPRDLLLWTAGRLASSGTCSDWLQWGRAS